MLSSKKSHNVVAVPSYLLFALAAVLIASVLLSLHVRYKSSPIAWSFYDPTFVYAFTETPDALAQQACQKNTVLGFGSSVFDSAVARRDANWLGWNHWRRYSGPLGDSLQIHSISRTASADLRLFDPLLSRLPDCPKIIVMQASLLLPNKAVDEGAWQDFRNYLIDAPRFFFASYIERYWAKPYQIEFQKPVYQGERAAAKPFDLADHAAIFRGQEEFQKLDPEHLQIITQLIANHAQVVIVEIGRSKNWEAAGKQQIANFREAMQELADSDSAIHYREFPTLESSYYTDYTHLNSRGADLFRPWLAKTIEEISENTGGF
jgi:hypothetical protein